MLTHPFLYRPGARGSGPVVMMHMLPLRIDLRRCYTRYLPLDRCHDSRYLLHYHA